MIGVVLWSDAEDGKAVFWCEDQGDLAYFESGGDCAVFEAGDMVQFDVTVESRLRRARNAQLVLGQAYPGLPDTLRSNASEPVGGHGCSNVVRLRQAHNQSLQVDRHQKRKA